MKKVFLLTLLVLFGTFEVKAAFKKNEKRILSEQVLKDKVKGAWAVSYTHLTLPTIA